MKIKRIIFYIFLFLLVLLGVSFAVLNAESVTVNYYLGKSTLPLSLLLIYTLGMGLLLGFFAQFFSVLRLRRENRKLKKEIEKFTAAVSVPPVSADIGRSD